ncbi:polysaccharide export outer membrane protein [Faunimonas pinastri]|uniref:Polysaccharide export outer membrane protein n=1 Tax=Faunimonas pinastri TaxID=1855383 RepID=A0A1H9CBE0_9HYPH|nr:polysaccharide biosynthesis/export family protein [Faunimonas pinastri]SEP98459.1 polysaccharide export outer membrane protein [Faunimonas pinastri]
MLRIRHILLLPCLAATLAGCATNDRPLPPMAVMQNPYRLDSGDELRITVFGQTDLSNTYRVDQSGSITMPLIGSIPARGATTVEMQQRIATKLSQSFLRNPNVTVEVAANRPFFVLGEVTQPGQYAYVPGMTAEMAIAVSGGFSPRANMGLVRVSRTVNGVRYEGKISVDEQIRPGDTIYVSERLF